MPSVETRPPNQEIAKMSAEKVELTAERLVSQAGAMSFEIKQKASLLAESGDKKVSDAVDSIGLDESELDQLRRESGIDANLAGIRSQAQEIARGAEAEILALDLANENVPAQEPSELKNNFEIKQEIASALDGYAEVKRQSILKKEQIKKSEKLGRELTPTEMEDIDQDVSAKISRVKEYFLTIDSGKRAETPIERIASVYEALGEVDQKSLQSHMQMVIELAFDQHLDNPEKYVSHGFDHTLNVADYTRRILSENPAIVDRAKELYGLSDEEAKFLIENISLFHDFGYPQVGERDKAAHGISGAEIISSDRSLDAIFGLVKVDPAKREALAHDLRDAVLFHSADKVESHYSVKITTRKGAFLTSEGNLIEVISAFAASDQETGADSKETTEIYVTRGNEESVLDQIRAAQEKIGKSIQVKIIDDQRDKYENLEEPGADADSGLITIHIVESNFRGRSADLREKKDAKIGLEYSEVDLAQEPFQGVIRVADNMDMRSSRLSEIQRDPSFKDIYEAFGDGGGVSSALKILEQAEKDWQKTLDGQSDQRTTILAQSRTVLESLGYSQDDIASTDSPKSATIMLKKKTAEHILYQDQYREYDQKKKDSIVELALAQNTESMRHFAGCKAVQGVELHGSDLIVTVDREEFERLNQHQVTESSLDDKGEKTSVMVGVGEYQIWRAQEAFRSTSMKGEAIKVKTIDQQGQEVGTSFGSEIDTDMQ